MWKTHLKSTYSHYWKVFTKVQTTFHEECQDRKIRSSKICQPMQQATGEINTNLPLKIQERSWNSGMLSCRKQKNIIHMLSTHATNTQVRDNFQGAQHSTHQLFSLLKGDIKGNQRQEMVSYLIKDTFKVNGQATDSNHASSHAGRKIDTSCLVHGRKRSSP